MIDLNSHFLDYFPVFFFFLSCILHFFIAFTHFLFQWSYFLNFIVCHADSCSVIRCFLEYFTDKRFTFLDELLFAFIGRFQSFVNLLVLLSEFLQVFAFEVIIKELFEFTLNSFILFLIKSKSLNLFSLLLSLVMSFDLLFRVVDIVIHVRHLQKYNL